MNCKKAMPSSLNGYLSKWMDEYLNVPSLSGLADDMKRAEGLWSDTHVSDKEYVGKCVCNRIRHGRRLKSAAVEHAAEKLTTGGLSVIVQNKEFNRAFDNFEDLYDAVYAAIGKGSTGIGRCTVYDTSLRLGHNISPQIEPLEYVYLHRCVKDSAKTLLGDKAVYGQYRVSRSLFEKKNKDFKKLSAVQIEDFLCIFSDRIIKLKSNIMP